MRLSCFLWIAPVLLAAGMQAQEPFRIEFDPEPPVRLAEPTRWHLTGLAPGSEVEVTAILGDEWGAVWSASAVFEADAGGRVRPESSAPLSGSYAGIDPWGLYWSGSRMTDAASTAELADESPVTFVVSQGDRELGRRTLERWVVAPNVDERPFRAEGLIGRTYVPAGANGEIAAILLGGSGGGMAWQRRMAAHLAGVGIPALALAYFGMEELPQRLERIPLEYVLDAVLAFGELESVDPDRIVLVGYSKGAELALLAASTFDLVAGVVAYAPSSVTFQAFLPPRFPAISSWTLDGVDCPFVPLKGYRPEASSIENWTTYLQQEVALGAAAIPIERIRGPILVLSGEEDSIWPSSLMGERLRGRFEEHGAGGRFRHRVFPDAGHGIAAPGNVPTGPTAARNGGTPPGNAAAQRASWMATVEFLRTLE